MCRFGGIIIFILLLLVGGKSLSQDLSPVVIPSEDELLDALRAGDISYEQYTFLREILIDGVDSTMLHLLDDIPNLALFRELSDSVSTPLETEQRHSVVRGSARGTVSHRYQALLDEDERHWYRTSVDLHFARRYRLLLKVNRARGGSERVTDRSISYTNQRGTFRRLTVGSFTTRLGLGTAFGHRGKLLDYADRLTGESFLVPDQGGYNGLLAKGVVGPLEVSALASIVRDSDYRIASTGMVLSRGRGSFRPGAILGHNALVNRSSGEAVHLPVFGGVQEYRYRRGYVMGELTFQTGAGRMATAAVIEGRHGTGQADIRYAGWTYDDDLMELTTGSKAASLSQADTLAEVDFAYTTKRAGQEGVLMRTTVELAENLTLSGGLISAQVSPNNALRQVSGGLDGRLGKKWQLDLEYLHKWRRHVTPSSVTNRASHRVSLGARFTAGALSARTYIAGGAEKGYRGFMSWFTDLRYALACDGQIRIWSNLSRFGVHGIKHWYAFVMASQNLTDRFAGAAKLAHTYQRSSKTSHETTLSLELTATL